MIEKINLVIGFIFMIILFIVLFFFMKLIQSKTNLAFSDVAYIAFITLSTVMMVYKIFSYSKLKQTNNINRKQFWITYFICFVFYILLSISPFIGSIGNITLLISLVGWFVYDTKLIKIIKPIPLKEKK